MWGRVNLTDSLDVIVDQEKAVATVSRLRTAEDLLRKIAGVLEGAPMSEEQADVYSEACGFLDEVRSKG
jgi:hypothetical protein